MRLDTFHSPVDIPAYVIYIVWLLVTVFNISLIVALWSYRKRTLIQIMLSVLFADLLQPLVSMIEALGIHAMREYEYWCSISAAAEESCWTITGYSLLLLSVEVFFRSTWRRGARRRSLRRKTGVIIFVLWIIGFFMHSLTVPFFKNICSPHTMDEQYRIVYKLSLVSMNLLIPMIWGFFLLLKSSHNIERNPNGADNWEKDFAVILLIVFTLCWIVKQVPTIVFWSYREVFIISDNLAYVLSNIRCLVTSIMMILFFSDFTSLGTCECGGELTKQLPIQRRSPPKSPPPIASASDL